MRRHLWLCIVPAILLGVGQARGEPPGDDEPVPKVEKFRTQLKTRSDLARRVNGVELKAKVEVVPVWGGEEIQIHWTMNYDGSRQPLVILWPTLEGSTNGQTLVIFYVEGKDGMVRDWDINSPSRGGWHPLGYPSEFLTIKKGESATGTIRIPRTRLWSRYTKQDEYVDLNQPPKAWVQLVHQPNDRGEWYDLDAWTGTLHTPVIYVPLTGWPKGSEPKGANPLGR